MAHLTSTSKTVLARTLTAAAALAVAACSNGGTVQSVREDVKTVKANLGVPRQWHNKDGSTAAATAKDSDGRSAPLKLPQSAAKDRVALETWWSRFNDPTLDRLVRTALQYSPDLRSMLARVEEARARRSLSRADTMPHLSGHLGARENYRRDHKSYTVSDGYGDYTRVGHRTSSSDIYTASLNASWEIDLFGKYRAATEAAKSEVILSEENFRAAQISLVAEVAETYVQLRSAEVRFGIAQRTVETHEQTLKLANWRKEAGTGDVQEVRLAESTLETARATIPTLQSEISQLRNRIAILTGNAPGKHIDDLLARDISTQDGLASALAGVPVAPSDVDAGIPARILAARPDVLAAERALEASAFRTVSAKAAYYPTINLSGSIGVEALKAGNLFSPDATVGSILAGLTQPIFDGFRIKQNIEIATAQQKQALLDYESVVLAALGEVEDSLVDVRRTGERLEILKRAAGSAAETSKLAGIRYRTGLVDISYVLDRQREQLGVEERAVTTAAAQTSAQIRLFKSLGGGWTPVTK